MNRFLSWCETETTLPAICTSQPEAVKPRFSQVCGLILLPFGAVGPASWATQSDMEGIIDNTDTGNARAKYIAGRGGLEEPEVIVANLGRRTRHKAGIRYRLEYEVSIQNDGQWALAQKLQGNYKAFRFWYLTQSGRIFGGQDGIDPDYIQSAMPLGAGHEDVEKAVFRIEWYADADPSRTLMPNFSPSGSGEEVEPTPISNVMFYQQSFENQSTNTLTWTKNSGALPTSNTKAQILVFMEGQKLEEGAAVHYTISHATAPGESEITINASTHYAGANYEVIAIITS